MFSEDFNYNLLLREHGLYVRDVFIYTHSTQLPTESLQSSWLQSLCKHATMTAVYISAVTTHSYQNWNPAGSARARAYSEKRQIVCMRFSYIPLQLGKWFGETVCTGLVATALLHKHTGFIQLILHMTHSKYCSSNYSSCS